MGHLRVVAEGTYTDHDAVADFADVLVLGEVRNPDVAGALRAMEATVRAHEGGFTR